MNYPSEIRSNLTKKVLLSLDESKTIDLLARSSLNGMEVVERNTAIKLLLAQPNNFLATSKLTSSRQSDDLNTGNRALSRRARRVLHVELGRME